MLVVGPRKKHLYQTLSDTVLVLTIPKTQTVFRTSVDFTRLFSSGAPAAKACRLRSRDPTGSALLDSLRSVEPVRTVGRSGRRNLPAPIVFVYGEDVA